MVDKDHCKYQSISAYPTSERGQRRGVEPTCSGNCNFHPRHHTAAHFEAPSLCSCMADG